MLEEDLVETQLLNLRIRVTGRPEADIEAVLDPLALLSVSLHDESGQIEGENEGQQLVFNSILKYDRQAVQHPRCCFLQLLAFRRYRLTGCNASMLSS
jgi:hypothetical protein